MHVYSPDDLERMRKDFRVFLAAIWAHLGLPAVTPIQNDIALYLMGFYMDKGKLTKANRRRMIQAFRGVGKSWETSAFVCWLLFRSIEEKILVVSASKDRSDSFTIFVKRLLQDVPFLSYLAPGRGCRDSNIAFDVSGCQITHAPSVKSVGITGQITGSRASVIIADDVEVLNNSLTLTMRERLAKAITEFDAVILPGGQIIYLGTPQTEESIYKDLPARGYDVMIWPAEVPELKLLEAYGPHLAPFVQEMVDRGDTPGTPTEPSRFDWVDLSERRMSYGKAGYQLQFMLNTQLSDAERYPLKLADLCVMSFDALAGLGPSKVVWASGPDHVLDVPTTGLSGDRFHKPMTISETWAPFERTIMAIDPSGRGADEAAYCVLKTLYGNIYLVESGGYKEGYSPETLGKMCATMKKWGVQRVITEENFGDGMFTALLRSAMLQHQVTGALLLDEDAVKRTQQKERVIIDTLEPVMMSHRLIVLESVIHADFHSTRAEGRERYGLFYQIGRITRDKDSLKQDDRLDALTIGVGYLTQVIKLDQTDSELKQQEKDKQAVVQAFMDGVLKFSLVPLQESREKPFVDPWVH